MVILFFLFVVYATYLQIIMVYAVDFRGYSFAGRIKCKLQTLNVR
jgi:hypothetical protein